VISKATAVFTINGQKRFSSRCNEIAEKGNSMADLLLFILETGMRIGEVLALPWDNFIESDNRTYIYRV
jgi:integrase